MDNDVQLEILQLEKLKTLCDELIALNKIKESHSEILSVLKIHYELTEDDLNNLINMLANKKKFQEDDQKKFNEVEKEFKKYCMVTDIDENLEYKKIKSKIANRLSKLRKEKTPDKIKNEEKESCHEITDNNL